MIDRRTAAQRTLQRILLHRLTAATSSRRSLHFTSLHLLSMPVSLHFQLVACFHFPRTSLPRECIVLCSAQFLAVPVTYVVRDGVRVRGRTEGISNEFYLCACQLSLFILPVRHHGFRLIDHDNIHEKTGDEKDNNHVRKSHQTHLLSSLSKSLSQSVIGSRNNRDRIPFPPSLSYSHDRERIDSNQ